MMMRDDGEKRGGILASTKFSRWVIACLSLPSFNNCSTWKALAFSNVPLSYQPRGRYYGATSVTRYRYNDNSARASASSLLPLFAASTDRSCIELTDPETGCQVVLVGCFHGSPSSALDVEREVHSVPPTDAIALELCSARFAGLRKSMAASAPESDDDVASNNSFQQKEQRQTPRVIRFLQVVGETIQKRGLSTGVATGILGGVSGLQTALSGFTPGLEFMTALEFTQQRNEQDCDIILADQVVDETIEKIGKLPRVIRSMMDEITSAGVGSSWEETQWGKMALALRTALTGDPCLAPDYQVNVGEVMTRNPAAIQEMSRLMIPPVVMTQLTLTVVNELLLPMEPAMAETTTTASSILWNPATFNVNSLDPAGMVLDALPHLVILSFMLTIAYSFLAVPVTQVILFERDDQLTRGIQAACRLAAAKHHNSDSGRPGRVVAVLGLLHINGVAQRLLANSEQPSSADTTNTHDTTSMATSTIDTSS